MSYTIFSHPLQKLTTFCLNSWSWWWQTNNVKDELALALLTLTLTLILVTLTWMFLKTSKHSRLPPLPPGPTGLPLVGNLLSLQPQLHSYFSSLARTHGPILTLRFGLKVGIIVTSPKVAREILKDHDVTFANRDVSVTTRAMEYGASDIVWTPHGPEWRMLRKVTVNGMLGGSAVNSAYNIRRREIRNTIRYFYCKVGSPVNVGEQMFLTVLNVITNMLWGGSVQGEERASIGMEFRQVVAEVTEQLGKPNVSDFFPGLGWMDLQGIKRKMKEVSIKLDRIFDTIIDQRKKMDGGKGSNDFLQVLLQMKEERDAKILLTMNHLKALLMDMVVGGTDTTSNTVEFALAEMMNQPKVMEKAQQELETIVGKDNIVEESHIHKLPYLQAVMKEVLRLHPALPLMVPHSPSESCVVAGYTVPKGARIFVNVWAIHRDPLIWENPSEFVPERFLNGKGDYSGNDFNYFPFGSGRRICAGIGMAERMLMFSLASLIHSFNWNLAKGEKLDLSEKFGIVLKKTLPLVAIPTPRLSHPSLYK